MNRKEAIAFFKKIQSLFEDINVTSLKLIEPNTSNQTSIGYQIRVSGCLNGDWIEKIKEIAEKEGLAVAVENDEVTIHKLKATD